jgi:hypothetical protein
MLSSIPEHGENPWRSHRCNSDLFSGYKKETPLATVCHCFEPSEWEGSQKNGEARRPADEHKNGTDGKGNPIRCFKKNTESGFFMAPALN